MLITGLGYYPNLGTKDAFLLVARNGKQTAVHLSDLIDQDRLNPHVGNYRIEVPDPLKTVRIVLEETEGMSADLTWEGTCPVVQEQPHVLRSGSRVTLDAQRFAQLGTWSGTIAIDGEEIAVDPATWLGSRDRSWGIRPVGEAEPPGAPADPPFEGMWWLYVPMQFEDFAIVPDHPGGPGRLPHAQRLHPGLEGRPGRAARLAARSTSTTRPAPARPTGATIRCTTPEGKPLVLEVESRLAVPLHVGGGYGGDPDWTHGVVEGRGLRRARHLRHGRRRRAGPLHVRLRRPRRPRDLDGAEGCGLFEHFCIGRHDPSGFADFFTLAP